MLRNLLIWLYEGGLLTPGVLMRHPRLVNIMVGPTEGENEER
jgi:hypothetical protein